MDPRNYDHRSKADLQALARELESTTPRQRALASVFAIGANLMNAPLSLRLSLKAITLVHGKAEGAIRFADALVARNPQVVDDLWRGVTGHMLHGKDTYDARSAGGWNKQELDKFVGFVRQMGWQPPGPAPQATIPAEVAEADVVAGRVPGR